MKWLDDARKDIRSLLEKNYRDKMQQELNKRLAACERVNGYPIDLNLLEQLNKKSEEDSPVIEFIEGLRERLVPSMSKAINRLALAGYDLARHGNIIPEGLPPEVDSTVYAAHAAAVQEKMYEKILATLRAYATDTHHDPAAVTEEFKIRGTLLAHGLARGVPPGK